ncbi:MAG: hypothetical protein JXQ73_06545 [Phycisphaerae bacterium]|nr:hypothetical protein [Phycisphaerae bacterium]
MGGDSPIVDEVRQRRMELSAQFGHDLKRYGEHIRALQEQYRDRLVSQITVIAAKPARKSSKKT